MSAARYLRVKNWEKFQHGSTKRLPWIKLFDRLLEDYHFCRLSDSDQLHLMKIWLLANRVGNKIPNDPNWVRSMIRTGRSPNLQRFVKEGFLERWSATDEIPAQPIKPSRRRVDKVASSSTPDAEGERDRDKGSTDVYVDVGLPFEKQRFVLRWLDWVGGQADEGTAQVVRSYAVRLPEGALAKVEESRVRSSAWHRARWLVGVLKAELAERAA